MYISNRKEFEKSQENLEDDEQSQEYPLNNFFK